ncbi:uncharacterized protein LOC119164269 [Rhipicephalus microplus]|uniref:Putative ml domain protein n=1 Tax=Rhipicephalus microplus TaxID=6941 RepID=A0A6G5A5T2_RHIMP
MFAAMSFTRSCTRILDQSMKIALVFVVAVALANSSHSQKLDVKQCSDHGTENDIEIKSANVKDLEVGKTVHVDIIIRAIKELHSNPQLKLDVFTSDKVRVPCVLGLGSCTYKMCDGSSGMEKFLSSAWEGKCPIKAQKYEKTLSFYVPSILRTSIGDGRFHFRAEMMDGGKTVGCQEFDVRIKV